MASDKSFQWSEKAVSTFLTHHPTDEEVDEVIEYMFAALAERIDTSSIIFNWDFRDQILFRCGRFGVTFCFIKKDENDDDNEAVITDIFLWEEARK